LINGALHQVTGQDSGLASGAQAAMQQIGGAIGVAVLIPIAVRYATDHISGGTGRAVAQAGGYALSFRIGAAILLVAGVLVMVLLERVIATPRTALAEVPVGQAPVIPSAPPGRNRHERSGQR
jgi:hypothetical protein